CRYDPQRQEMYARRRQMKRNNNFQKLRLWGALDGLALLGNTIAWSRSTSQPPSLNGKLRRQESQQSAASSSYAVRAIEESVSGTVSGRILYRDRKSTRLNSSHVAISYAVFCLKKKITNAT